MIAAGAVGPQAPLHQPRYQQLCRDGRAAPGPASRRAGCPQRGGVAGIGNPARPNKSEGRVQSRGDALGWAWKDRDEEGSGPKSSGGDSEEPPSFPVQRSDSDVLRWQPNFPELRGHEYRVQTPAHRENHGAL